MKHAVALGMVLAGLLPERGSAGLIGEVAPPLSVKEWIQGQPIQIKPGTNLYLLEIWTSWSEASRASITNLNALQRAFGDRGLIVLGISDEPVDKVREFVQKTGTNIGYAIAVDDQRRTGLNYMRPIDQQAVPYAFLIGTNGTVVWHGHPLADLRPVLEQVAAGRYNVGLAKTNELHHQQMVQYLALSRRGDNRTRMAGQILLAARTNDVPQLCELAFQIATDAKSPRRDFPLAAEALAQAERLAPTNTPRVTITRAILLFEAGKREEGLTKARAAVATAPDPKAKAYAEACLQAMEAKAKPASTNLNQIPAGKP